MSPDGLNTVNNGEWEDVELAVDSGASETVINEGMVASVRIQEGEASIRGVEYEVANGVRTPNQGEKRFIGVSSEGISRKLAAQVCDANKGMLNMSKLKRGGGSRVVLDAGGPFIEDKRIGGRMNLSENNGMYMITLWTKKGV